MELHFPKRNILAIASKKMSLGLVIWFKYGRLLNLHQNLYGQKVTFNLAQYRLTVEDVFNSSLAGWSVRIQTGMNTLKKFLAPTVPKFITIWLQFHRWRSWMRWMAPWKLLHPPFNVVVWNSSSCCLSLGYRILKFEQWEAQLCLGTRASIQE